MATQRFYDGQPGPDIRRELNNFEAKVDGIVAAAQDASAAATSASVKVQQWADAAPGVEVETGKYSAKHWAARAQTTVTGGLIYRGSHSAASGAYPATPSLGDYYKISAAGTLGGVDYSVGDSIIYNGADWDKIDSTDAVTSVAGRVGEVVLTKADVGLGSVDNTSDADKPISSATQTALNGKAAALHGHAVADVTGLQPALDGKVDKVPGKGLSTEDYTTSDKAKVAGLGTAAAANLTTSKVDTTAGRVLKVGDFGIGRNDLSIICGPSAKYHELFRSSKPNGWAHAGDDAAANYPLGIFCSSEGLNEWFLGSGYNDGNLYYIRQNNIDTSPVLAKVVHTGKVQQSTGGNTEFPMSQAAVTNAILRPTPVATSGGVMDCALGNYFTATVSGNTTLSFANIPGGAYSCVLEVRHTAGTITFPAGTVWSGGAPTLSPGRHLFFLRLAQLGTAGWYASVLQGYSA